MKADITGIDSFALIVAGKNRHDEGSSAIQITVSGLAKPFAVVAVKSYENAKDARSAMTEMR